MNRLREFWTAIEKRRHADERWIDACERVFYEAMTDEGLEVSAMASAMTETQQKVRMRLTRWSLRRKDRRLKAV